MRRERRESRGQALVETVLGMLAFVTVLIFGIFFAEVGALSLKVNEAANFAIWDATGRGRQPNGELERDWNRYRDAAEQAEDEAQQRYEDFDGRSSVTRGATPLEQVMARASSIRVRCDDTAITGIGPGDASVDPGPSPLTVSMPGMNANLGIACKAHSVMRGFRIPRRILDGRFHKENYSGTPIRICSSTRGANDDGECRGELATLLDDWGLATLEEGNECHLAKEGGTGCANSHYYEWVRKTFQSHLGGGASAGSGLAGLVGGSPISEDHFYMSFRGAESDFTEQTGISHGGTPNWETTPFREVERVSGIPYARVYGRRCARWLGRCGGG